MKPYHLLIIAYPSTWETVSSAVQMVTCGLVEGFQTLPHVTLAVEPYPLHLSRTMPAADVVLVHSYVDNYLDSPAIRQATGAKLVASFAEIPFGRADKSFLFAGSLRLPCVKRLMQNVPKEPGSLLIDHHWPIHDRTAEIEGWLSDWKGPLYTLAGRSNTPPSPRLTPLRCPGYLDYLRETARIERFIFTHEESYGFSAIDMAARGIQVLAPRGALLHKELRETLRVALFASKAELLDILARPVGDEWNHKIDLCTDYADVAKEMDRHFQEWLA